uniref:Uncharacterized protein n=1 Tax=Timema tahoe TaxID=61484 RepID=A0A7R9NXF4_9NEOP|nr:unnamed protein product [Timema tahoe]
MFFLYVTILSTPHHHPILKDAIPSQLEVHPGDIAPRGVVVRAYGYEPKYPGFDSRLVP